MKKTKKRILISIVVCIGLFFYCIIPVRITPKKELSNDDIKIRVNLQVTTGPLYYVSEDKDKLWSTIKDKYPNVNSTDIDLVGNTPNFAVSDPVYLGDFDVYGHVVGTVSDGDVSTIPQFYVVYSDAKLSPIEREDYSFKYLFLIVPLLPLITLGLIIALLIILFKERKSKVKKH